MATELEPTGSKGQAVRFEHGFSVSSRNRSGDQRVGSGCVGHARRWSASPGDSPGPGLWQSESGRDHSAERHAGVRYHDEQRPVTRSLGLSTLCLVRPWCLVRPGSLVPGPPCKGRTKDQGPRTQDQYQGSSTCWRMMTAGLTTSPGSARNAGAGGGGGTTTPVTNEAPANMALAFTSGRRCSAASKFSRSSSFSTFFNDRTSTARSASAG